MSSGRPYLTWFQVAVSVGCLAWLAARPEIHQGLWEAILQADLSWLGIGLLVAGGVVALGIVRWQLFLRLQGLHLSWGETTKLSLIGGFFNLILIGAVGGDAIKILYLIRRFPQKKSQAVASILMDHLCGLPVVIFFYAYFCLTRWEWLATTGLSSQIALFAGIYLGASLIGVGLLFLVALLGLTKRTPPGLPWRDHAIRFCDTLTLFIKHWPASLLGIFLSFFIHLLYFATFGCGAQAVQAGVRWLDLFTIMPVVDVITTLPVSISGLGLRETLLESFLSQLCQVAPERGVMVSLLGFGMSAAWSVLGGLLFPFYRPKGAATWRQVVRQAKAA